MRQLGVLAALVALGWLCLSAGSGQDTPPGGVTMQPMSYGDLGHLVRAHKGKVVVVDFWADYCAPCKKAFPHLVQLHQKHARDGLVVISVNLDDPANAD